MRLKVNFREIDEKLNVKFQEIHEVSDGGYDKGYNDGYGKGYGVGNTEGYENGYSKGEQVGYEKGYEVGYGESYDKGFDKGFIDGKQAEYDKFWDKYQDNGNRTNYTYAFRDKYWTDEIFNPKYDLILTQCSSMFQSSGITNLASKLKEKGIKLDTSGCTTLLQMFQSSQVKDIPELNASNCTSLSYTFGSEKVETIEKLIISEKLTVVGNAFNKAYTLKHCIFDGVLAVTGTGMNLKDCILLDKESITSLVNILSTTTSGLTVTLSLTAVNKAFETSENANDGRNSTEWQTLVNTKTNWTINLS